MLDLAVGLLAQMPEFVVREQVSYDDLCEPLRHPDEIVRTLGVLHERPGQQLPALQSRVGRILASPVAIPVWKPLRLSQHVIYRLQRPATSLSKSEGSCPSPG
jgi:hypothetical protein